MTGGNTAAVETTERTSERDVWAQLIEQSSRPEQLSPFELFVALQKKLEANIRTEVLGALSREEIEVERASHLLADLNQATYVFLEVIAAFLADTYSFNSSKMYEAEFFKDSGAKRDRIWQILENSLQRPLLESELEEIKKLYASTDYNFSEPLDIYARGPLREFFQSRFANPEYDLLHSDDGIKFQEKYLHIDAADRGNLINLFSEIISGFIRELVIALQSSDYILRERHIKTAFEGVLGVMHNPFDSLTPPQVLALMAILVGRS